LKRPLFRVCAVSWERWEEAEGRSERAMETCGGGLVGVKEKGREVEGERRGRGDRVGRK
jgi:hypothetical protein